MQKKLKFILGVLSCVTVVQSPAQETSLWYDAPADEWMKSLPVGNGRVGAMVFGGVDEETVALNESSMWAGEYDPNQEKPFGREKLDELRKLFFEGKLIEGNGIAGRELVGTPHSFGTHLPIGDLKIKFDYTGKEGGVEDYRRELDLTNAVVTVSFKKGGTKYKREFISSNPQDAVVMHFTADKKQSVSFDMRMKMITAAQVRTEGNLLVFDGQALFPKLGTGGVHFQGRVVVKVDRGEVEATGETVRVKHADAVTIVADVRTDYKNGQYESLCEKTVEKAIARPFETMKEEHVADYAPLFARVSLKLADDSKKSIPVDRRWKALCEGNKDAGLQALFFQYGRYLTIASSRENSPLPIALQGFFNDNLACNMCWTSDYHLDINTEQNYWLTNVGNLAECNAPLFTYIADLAHHGAKTVRTVYGCKGWTAHTVANVWGFTAPSEGMGWGLFPLAGSWMATHLWTQYEYTLDKDYLRRTAYPLLKGNAEFLLDYMVEDPNTGYMVTGPCVSPENSFRYQGWELGASMMTTCDKVLAHEIMSACVQASDILGVDKAFADSLRLALAKFPPFRINSFGGLCEWYEVRRGSSQPPPYITFVVFLSIRPNHERERPGIDRSGEDDDRAPSGSRGLGRRGMEPGQYGVFLCPSERCGESGRKPEHPHDGFCARELADHIARRHCRCAVRCVHLRRQRGRCRRNGRDADTGAGGLRGAFALLAGGMEGRQFLRTLCERRSRSVGRVERQPGGEGFIESHGRQPVPFASACGKGLHGAPEREKVRG